DRFVKALPDHVILALDEAYYEFLDNPPASLDYVKEGRKVVLMRTFSKIQGLAGIRIGYGLACSEISDLLQRARQPFNTNSIAQAGALAGLMDHDHQRKTKQITDLGRSLFQDAFQKRGLPFVPSAANFVLLNVGDANHVFKALLQKGIIVRSMVSYKMPEWIRVSIGTNEQNLAFLKALDEVLKKA
ncbi:MAG: histidinol-phosphate transaminase, partial [Verrucomicrobiota bacterium]